VKYIIEDAEPSIMIATKKRIDKDVFLGKHSSIIAIEDICSQIEQMGELHLLPVSSRPDHPVSLIYTSGSTGKPKGVISTHGNIHFSVNAIQNRLGYRKDDVIGNFLPLSFDYGLYQVFLTFNVGATLALGSPTDVGPHLLNLLCEWKVTGLPSLPSIFYALIKIGNRKGTFLPALRFITNTGANLPPAYVKEVRALLPKCDIYLMYGLTECKRVSILLPYEMNEKMNSVGRPLPNTTCVIVDSECNELSAGEIGELVVKGPHVTLGYWKDVELTSKYFKTWRYGSEKVLFTGDLCSIDEEGYLYFHGRIDDIFKQRGHRVSAVEIEDAVHSISGVHQAVLLPTVNNEEAVLFIVTELSVEQVRDQLKLLLEEYKIPHKIEKISKLPVTNNGKYDKKKLRDTLKGVE